MKKRDEKQLSFSFESEQLKTKDSQGESEVKEIFVHLHSNNVISLVSAAKRQHEVEQESLIKKVLKRLDKKITA